MMSRRKADLLCVVGLREMHEGSGVFGPHFLVMLQGCVNVV
jgi:hypothetical protein